MLNAWAALLHPPWPASPQVTADLWRSNATHANLDTWMCCAFLPCRWILANSSPGATPHPHTVAGSQATAEPSPNAAINTLKDAWMCRAFLDVLHFPLLTLDVAANTASDRKAPGHTTSIAKYCSKRAFRRAGARPRSRQSHRQGSC
jgi:hypothetical protein